MVDQKVKVKSTSLILVGVGTSENVNRELKSLSNAGGQGSETFNIH